MDSIFFRCQNSESSLKLWNLYCSHSPFQSKYHVYGHTGSECVEGTVARVTAKPKGLQNLENRPEKEWN